MRLTYKGPGQPQPLLKHPVANTKLQGPKLGAHGWRFWQKLPLSRLSPNPTLTVTLAGNIAKHGRHCGLICLASFCNILDSRALSRSVGWTLDLQHTALGDVHVLQCPAMSCTADASDTSIVDAASALLVFLGRQRAIIVMSVAMRTVCGRWYVRFKVVRLSSARAAATRQHPSLSPSNSRQ